MCMEKGKGDHILGIILHAFSCLQFLDSLLCYQEK